MSDSCTLADAVGDFCDFENGIDFGLDALKFAGAVEGSDPLAEVVEGQRVFSLRKSDYTESRAAGWRRGCQTQAPSLREDDKLELTIWSGAW